MNITTSPAFDIAATRAVAKINAARPKDDNGKFISSPMTVQEFATANLEAIGKSWGEAQATEDLMIAKARFELSSRTQQQAALAELAELH